MTRLRVQVLGLKGRGGRGEVRGAPGVWRAGGTGAHVFNPTDFLVGSPLDASGAWHSCGCVWLGIGAGHGRCKGLQVL